MKDELNNETSYQTNNKFSSLSKMIFEEARKFVICQAAGEVKLLQAAGAYLSVRLNIRGDPTITPYYYLGLVFNILTTEWLTHHSYMVLHTQCMQSMKLSTLRTKT